MTVSDVKLDKLIERLRNHVQSRGGPAKDEDGNYIGIVWPVMLEAATALERLLPVDAGTHVPDNEAKRDAAKGLALIEELKKFQRFEACDIVTLHTWDAQIIIGALELLCGVAAGTHKIVPVEALNEMEARKDAVYLERNQVVAALTKVFPSTRGRTAIEGWSEDWHGCVYIQLPTGQVSWHYHDSHDHLFSHVLFEGETIWDGHTTEEKYRRLAAYRAMIKEQNK